MENKNVFSDLIQKTRDCMSGLKEGEDDLQCETAYLSDGNLFTYHTHPNGVREPSSIISVLEWFQVVRLFVGTKGMDMIKRCLVFETNRTRH